MTHLVTDLLRAPVSTGVELCYQTFGDPDREPLLLVMGLGGPLTWWDDALCRRLADEGFRFLSGCIRRRFITRLDVLCLLEQSPRHSLTSVNM